MGSCCCPFRSSRYDHRKDAGADDTFNFQKASCTLDASVKIYSYRVDDTWNSSYKILENLSRTEDKHGNYLKVVTSIEVESS